MLKALFFLFLLTFLCHHIPKLFFTHRLLLLLRNFSLEISLTPKYLPLYISFVEAIYLFMKRKLFNDCLKQVYVSLAQC